MVCRVSASSVSHYLPEFLRFMSIESMKLSNHPLPSSPPAFTLSQHQGLFQWVSSLHQMARGLELQLQHQSFQRFCLVGRTGEPGGLPSMGSHRVGHDWSDLAAAAAASGISCRKIAAWMRRVFSSQFLENQTIHCALEPFSKALREMPHVLYYPLKESESLLFSSCVIWKIEA